jgi:protein TonB
LELAGLMHVEQTVPTLDAAHALRPSLLAPASQRQPLFWLALLAAALVHAALVVGISRTEPRYLGDPNGRADAIDVELVDAGELRAMGTPPAQPQAPPEPPAPAATQPAPPPAEPPQQQTEAETAPPPPQQSAALPALDELEPQATAPPNALPQPAPPQAMSKQSEPVKKESAKSKSAAKPAQKAAPKPPTQLDLSVPSDLAMQGAASGGASSGATRPPGITRSGENDRFGRGVIRALKKTMPPSEGITGKVTVRIFLNERGNIDKLTLVQGSGDRGLDDNVLFSVQQAAIPFPPKGATVADRTFLVTYIYRP